MDRWISADIVTLDSEGHDLKLLEPNPNPKHDMKSEVNHPVFRCIPLVFSGISRYVMVCLCLFRTCLILRKMIKMTSDQ
jgi:hypothetical protein